MTILPSRTAVTHERGGARFTSLATPSRGATETAVWAVEIAPGTPATPHSLSREEVFVVLEGVATVQVSGEPGSAGPGDAIVVPVGAEVALSNDGEAPLRMLCCLPVGGEACLPDGTRLTPPWSQ
jgi:quercetin dioxygenase-like cupin family protein